MKVLVTGGSGFIGRNIIKQAREKGWETASLDLVDAGVAEWFTKGSVTNMDLMRQAIKGVDIVFHEAATTSPPEFEKDPSAGFFTNSQGTFNVLKAAENEGTEKVILASSSSLYGDKRGITSESDIDTQFKNVYPLSKYINEISAKYFAENTELKTICLRYFNTYGIGENSKGMYSSVISKFIQAMQENVAPVIFGNGEQRRDFVYVKDVANANILAAKNGKNGQVYNIGTGVSTTFNEIFRVAKTIMNVDLEPIYSPVPFKSYQFHTQADIEKAMKELNFVPSYDIKRGITEMVANISR